jgi:dTDP-4-amino-4,6-dideoxygalactose transaminase
VFNTFEGGAIICPDAKTKQRIDHLKNFGFVDETTVVAPGINGKMSEINAAFGVLQLQHMSAVKQRRAEVDVLYRDGLKDIQGIHCLPQTASRTRNHSYFPILVEPDYPLSRDALYQKLKDHGINGRRYFYPLISEFPMYRGLPSSAPGNLPVASDAAQRVLCLPIYPALTTADQQRTIDVIARH